MIPKIIHYCWFGRNRLPELAQQCIASWKKFLPDYEIREWNEENFDVNTIPFTAEAYRQKKYAFVSDYARFWILYRFGGIYFDTDVEVIRPMDDIIKRGNFMGFEMDPDGENTPGKYAPGFCFDVNPGLGFGMEKEHPFMKRMMDCYNSLEFTGAKIGPWFKTVVAYTTEHLCKDGLKNIKGIQVVGDITVYPREYFAPINIITNKLTITKNTRTIHRYMASWSGTKERKTFKKVIRHYMPESILIFVNKIKRRKYRIE